MRAPLATLRDLFDRRNTVDQVNLRWHSVCLESTWIRAPEHAQIEIEMLPYIERILEAARSAPSRDNLQPWRFVVEGTSISFLVDHERDRSVMNTGDRMARIAVGAALECALVRAARMGLTVRFPATPRPGALVTITVSEPKRFTEPDKAFRRRITNRRPYDGRPLDDATLALLRNATPAIDTVRTHWFGRERVRILGPLVEEAETLFYADPGSRDAILSALRFDARDRDEVAHGLSLGCLELSAPDRIALDSLRRAPHALLAGMVAKKMGGRERKLVESASGICILSARGDDPTTDVIVGRCLQRAWRALAGNEMAAQPLSSLPALEAIVEPGSGATLDAANAESTTALLNAFRGAFPGVERGARIAFVMRFGWAPEPSARVGRRPLAESIGTDEALSPHEEIVDDPEGIAITRHAARSERADDPLART